jgi:3-oxoacyl-[acyl-carrier-protein] synthase II
MTIAITGLGAISAAGGDVPALTQALFAGRSCLRTSADPDLPLAATVPVGAVAGDVPSRQPRTVALGLVAAREALDNARFPLASRLNLGLALGSCTGGMREGGNAFFGAQPAPYSPAYRHQPIGRSALRLAQALGIRGPLTAHAEACASAACAMSEAASWIEQGLCSAVVVVGADALTRLTMAGFTSLQVVDPSGCRPFTSDRAGMSLGEGACAVVLEDADHARRRGAPVRAWLRGWAVNADAYHATAPDPSGQWLEHAVRSALTQAGRSPADIDLVAAHGTGTRDNDASEAAVLARLHPGLVVSSHKGCLGHTLGAAAAFGVASALIALEHQMALPSAGGTSATALSGITIHDHATPARIDTALVTCLAFGGINAALVVSRSQM